MISYEEKYIYLIKKSKHKRDLIEIINKIYEDGFEDGSKEGG